jgi:hypothetical protein
MIEFEATDAYKSLPKMFGLECHPNDAIAQDADGIRIKGNRNLSSSNLFCESKKIRLHHLLFVVIGGLHLNRFQRFIFIFRKIETMIRPTPRIYFHRSIFILAAAALMDIIHLH